MSSDTLYTKYGNARLTKKGYYLITSRKEGNNQKKLHRLIYEDYYNITLLPWTDIHHKDGNKTNNEISNLEAIFHDEHSRNHMKGDRNPMNSEKVRLKLSETRKGVDYLSPKQRYLKTKVEARRHNKLGLFRVSKASCPQCKDNYRYRYIYTHKGKKISFSSRYLVRLKQRVVENGLEWCVVNEDKAKLTAESEGLSLEDLL